MLLQKGGGDGDVGCVPALQHLLADFCGGAGQQLRRRRQHPAQRRHRHPGRVCQHAADRLDALRADRLNLLAAFIIGSGGSLRPCVCWLRLCALGGRFGTEGLLCPHALQRVGVSRQECIGCPLWLHAQAAEGLCGFHRPRGLPRTEGAPPPPPPPPSLALPLQLLQPQTQRLFGWQPAAFSRMLFHR
jgi:hypothetical protein